MNVQQLEISSIHVGRRVRTDLGDLSDLCESMRTFGLLQPIVVKTSGLLVAGARRLTAAGRLGWQTISCNVTDDLNEIAKARKAERDENTCRKDFTPLEIANMARDIREEEAAAAAERQAATRAKPGNDGKNPTGGAKLAPPVNIEKKGKTVDRIAEEAGVGKETVRKIEQVVKAAEEDPKLFGDLPEKMNNESVDAAHKELKKRAPKKPAAKQSILDADGFTVPDPLRDVFGDQWLNQLEEIIDGMRTQVNSPRVLSALKGKSGAYSAFLSAGEALQRLAEADDALEQVESIIRAGKPYAVHQECGGKGCTDCRNAGWVPQWRHNELKGA
jgi:ParB-like chromosome segregation protein Spo0J